MRCIDKLNKLATDINGYNGYADSKESNKIFLRYVGSSLDKLSYRLSRSISESAVQAGDLNMYLEMIRSYIIKLSRYIDEYSGSDVEVREDVDKCDLIELDHKIFSILNKLFTLSSLHPSGLGLIADFRMRLQMILDGLKRIYELLKSRERMLATQ